MTPAPLPIDAALPEALSHLRAGSALVLEAPPGAGKTTRLPRALFEAGLCGGADASVVVLEPRRLAARNSAARVTEELGQRVGELAGYQVRFESAVGPRTRLRYVTEGLLTRQLVADPTLRGVGAVVLDEFHERHLQGDLALAILRDLQRGPRADLKLVVMSATLDAEPLAAWLGAPRVRSTGRAFSVAVEHDELEDERPLEQRVVGAVKRLVQDGLDGHVLVFLPGASEIRRAQESCADFAARKELELHALHGELSLADQDKALRPSSRRKLILATNVAETSITIEGVAAVVDSGLARVATHSPWTGLPSLKVAKISKASAVQRAGRAGRTRDGRCLRLYTRADFEGRPAADAPEIRRADFAEAALALRTLGVRDVRSFPYFEAPPASAIESAEALLSGLGALDRSGELTDLGRRLARLPLHPRLARVVVEAERRGVADDGVAMAALLGERDLRLERRVSLHERSSGRDAGPRGGPAATTSGPSDVLELLERYRAAKAHGPKRAGVEPAAFSAVERSFGQLLRLVDRRAAAAPSTERDREEALLQCVLAGSVDRVARRRRPKAPELLLAAGGSATLDAASVVHDAELLVAVDAEERRGAVTVRLASRVEPEWLLELASEAVTDTDELVWNASAERVDRLTRLAFGAIALEETRRPAPPSAEAEAVLVRAALAAGPEAFVGREALERFRCRLNTLREGFPEAGFPEVDARFLEDCLRQACTGLRSFDELRAEALLEHFAAKLTPRQAALARTEAPDRITLPGGRTVAVHYEPGRPPWIESRLQDFFGSVEGPRIGRLPLVLHLLAPNHNAVQVTTDLAGFWERHYPAVRRELMRQYPKHAWPEDPRTAAPPQPRPRR